MNSNTNKTAQVFNIALAEVKLPEINPNQLKRSQEDWVKYGDKNNFPDYLIAAQKKATVHSSFINTKQGLIKAEGITYSDNIAPFLEQINEELETANDLLDQVATDLSVLETFAVQVRYNKLKDKIVALDYIDSSKVRPSKTLDERGRVQGYWLCADWTNVRENVPVYVERFNPQKITSTTQLFFYHKRALGQPFLPEISYASALNFIELSYELSKYALNTVFNGFFASAIMNVKAPMTDEQKQAFTSQVKNSFTGSENAAKLMVVVSEDENSVNVTPISTTDNTPLFNSLRKTVIEEICSAHRGQGILAGVQNEGSSLGSDGKLYNTALKVYDRNVIRPLQKSFLTFLERVLNFNGATEYELEITSTGIIKDTTLDNMFLQDVIKAEVLAAEMGYTPEDIKPEVLEAPELPEVEPAEDVLQPDTEELQ